MAISGLTAKSMAALGATAALAALCGWAFGAGNAERSLGRSVASALSERVVIAARPAASQPSDQFDAEALRLSSWAGHEPAAAGLRGSIRVGDRITIGGSDGRLQTLEVVESRPFDADVTRVDTAPERRFVLVTARVVAETGRLVRFIVESDAEAPAAPAALRSHRAL
jgi:hypothetical protein